MIENDKEPIVEENSENSKIIELEDKFIRLYSEFENYKKRVQKEKDDIKNNTKVSMISSLLDVDGDIAITIKNIKDDETRKIVQLISSKIEKFLNTHGVELIQTETYDPDLHEVISVIENGESKILDVSSRGYTLNGKPFRYPKVVISK